MERTLKKSRDAFDEALRKGYWNLLPQEEIKIPSSRNALANAAKAIAICAYPQRSQLKSGAKAHKYAQALLAYMFRVSQWVGELEQLPPWAAELKAEHMRERLATGHDRLIRSFVIRDLISSALTIKLQNDAAVRGDHSTFLLQYSSDLKNVKIEIPLKKEEGGYRLIGKAPSKQRASLREAVTRHKQALMPFAGISPRIEGLDDEYFYQNALNRFIKPTLQISHILQVVWEAATKYRREAEQRKLPIDQILMRKATWAENIDVRAAQVAATAIFNMRELGINSCSCKLVHIGPPLPDS